MSEKNDQQGGAIVHGAGSLPSVLVDSWNIELKDGNGFLGDRASKRAFTGLLQDWREKTAKLGADPFGDTPAEELGRKALDKILLEGDPRAAGLILSAIEDFAGELATVLRRFLKLKEWQGTERIAIGGGMRQSRYGELVIGRTEALLKAEGLGVELVPIFHHPDEAALIGAAHLAPSWIFKGHEALIGVDIGGTNMRAGVVKLNQDEKPGLAAACVWKSDLWRHADEKPTRNEAVERLAKMILKLTAAAKKKGLDLAPFIGVGCPGVIREDGSIAKGTQNLPGNWEAKGFFLPERLREAIPEIGGHETMVLMHNDAVLQGLSEIPAMTDVEKWGVVTIGTGLGNARFTTRAKKN
ncbi:glucokinase [Agaricicola taiwanensis]|uniref:Glucokinase n=1 Tax=Agaricicola taiwanensis TaxID=591372 RepID=A0A8J2VGE4_9RHOB|nr:ROK family protein [Agaricicola taiwanensis]GGE29405.1 glucokinase [Agaricicola taiwanensis]